MKQLIVLAVTLPLMLLMIVQYSLDQINYAKINSVNDIVYNYKEKAKQEGCFTEELICGLKSDLAALLKLSTEEIYVSATNEDNEKYRGELIHYQVTVPVGKVMAGASFLGISKQDNIYVYNIDSYTSSEKLE